MRSNKLIQLYITNMCNSHCKTCSIWKNKQREELSVSDIESIVKAYPDADYVIGGGEALLHSQISEILEMLRIRNVKYTLLSNCISVSRLWNLVETFKVPAVTISFDGESHDEIRGSSGNTNSIMFFKDWCEKRGVKFKISYTYSKFNEEVFKSDMELIKHLLGQNKVYFCLAQDMRLLMTTEADENFVANDFTQILECDMLEQKDMSFIRGMVNGVRKVCDSQTSVHTIYSNGNIVRCQSHMSKDVIANIKGQPVEVIQDMIDSIEKISCPYDAECNLLCQRRYDYDAN